VRFREVLRFELRYQLRQPTTWACLALLLGVPLLLLAGGANPVGTGDRFDAPLKIASFTLLVGLLGTLVTAALFVEAGHRDPRWRTESFFYTAPLRKGDYLGGRFLGVLLVNALLLLAIPAGLLLGSRLPAVSAQPLGPFRAQAYLLPYLLLLPNLLVSAAVLFGVTVLSRRSLPGYLGALGLIATYLVALNTSAGSDSPAVLALVDPIGVVALGRLTKGWARVEQNTRLIGLEGVLAWNRLLWTALGAAMLAVTHHRFRLAHPAPGAR
jgi:ABC-2 type transport system permease protein